MIDHGVWATVVIEPESMEPTEITDVRFLEELSQTGVSLERMFIRPGVESARPDGDAARGELRDALGKLVDAARPYVENAAPHEELFNGEDLRNFDRLTEAMASARAALGAVVGCPPEEPTDAEVEAVARVMFHTTAGPAHEWETIADPGRDLWRHNARMALIAAAATRPEVPAHAAPLEPSLFEAWHAGWKHELFEDWRSKACAILASRPVGDA